MGLDNGFIIRSSHLKKSNFISPDTLSLEENSNGDQYEIAYWRKCWGVRQQILGILREDSDNIGEYPVSSDQLKPIIKALKEINTPKNWQEEAISIWDYDEMKKANERNIKNLRRASRFLKRYPDAKLIFYDSY